MTFNVTKFRISELFFKCRKIKLNLDGPFSSPMEDTTQYSLVLCVAGGIGITPFASFLNAFR